VTLYVADTTLVRQCSSSHLTKKDQGTNFLSEMQGLWGEESEGGKSFRNPGDGFKTVANVSRDRQSFP